MTREEYDNLQPGDRVKIARDPGYHSIPHIGYEFTVLRKHTGIFIEPISKDAGKGGSWGHEYCDVVSKKDQVINKYQIF